MNNAGSDLDKLRDTLTGHSLMRTSHFYESLLQEPYQFLKIKSQYKYLLTLAGGGGSKLAEIFPEFFFPKQRPGERESPGLQSLLAFLSHSTEEGQKAKSRS